MTIARKYLIDHSKTCFYHCTSRCVDQSFLLKKSPDGDECRSEWIETWLVFLGNIFAIDVLSYAIMGNHTHSVLHVNHSLMKSWSDEDILKRRSSLGKIPEVCHLFLNKTTRMELSEIEITIVLELVSKYREELCSISCFMQRLNSHIAVRANKEDGRKGHFWEGRFKSQALLNEEAILACMAYVDLNPIRAGLYKSLIDSKHTSIRRRLLISNRYSSTKMLPIRKFINQDSLADVCKISLESYVAIVLRIVNRQDFDDLLNDFNNFIQDKSNWHNLALDFEEQVGMASGDAELVSKFENQARASNHSSESKFKKIAASILSELRDIQYQSDKKHHSS